jgi:hypothetical protein
MKFIRSISDRLLTLLAPKFQASAECCWSEGACGPGGLGEMICCKAGMTPTTCWPTAITRCRCHM